MDAYFYITALGHIGAYAYKYGSLGTGRKWRVPRASSSELGASGKGVPASRSGNSERGRLLHRGVCWLKVEVLRPYEITGGKCEDLEQAEHGMAGRGAATGLLLSIFGKGGSPLVPVDLAFGIGGFIVGWTFQFVRHAWEGRKPAFVDDLVGLVIGPLFVTVEVLFLLGLRKPLKQRIEARVSKIRHGSSRSQESQA